MVQGVGFRFTVQRLAQDYQARGWVKNISSGSVKIIAEAEEEDLNKFIEQIKVHFADYIKDTVVNWRPAENKYKEFKVAY